MPELRGTSRRRKWTRRIVLCLLLGAALQYLVAAGFGLVGTYHYSNSSACSLRGSQGPWSTTLWLGTYSSPGREVLFGAYAATPAGPRTLEALPSIDWNSVTWEREFELLDGAGEPPAWSRFARIAEYRDPNCYPTIYLWDWFTEVGSGWPLTSASYVTRWRNDSGRYVVQDGAVLANVEPDYWTTPRVIPLKIYWPGAIRNTLLYAAALLMLVVLLLSIQATRRHLRRRIGRCMHCNYDLRGAAHAVCPECGAPPPRPSPAEPREGVERSTS